MKRWDAKVQNLISWIEIREKGGAKLEYDISCFAKRKESKDLNANMKT